MGCPEGHPKIRTGTLWRSLKWRVRFLQDAGCSVEITTQFGFDPDAVLHWVQQLRNEGVDATVRNGVPGPADTGKLLRCARQFGVLPSPAVAERYGLSEREPQWRVCAERYWDGLSAGIAAGSLCSVPYQLYPFGGILDGVSWMKRRLADRLPALAASQAGT